MIDPNLHAAKVDEAERLSREVTLLRDAIDKSNDALRDAIKTKEERDAMRTLLSEIQGSLHVINASASHIRRWIKDPNVDVEYHCRTIEEYRAKIHKQISALLFPEKQASGPDVKK